LPWEFSTHGIRTPRRSERQRNLKNKYACRETYKHKACNTSDIHNYYLHQVVKDRQAAQPARASAARRMRRKPLRQNSSSKARFTTDYSGASRVGFMRLLGGIVGYENNGFIVVQVVYTRLRLPFFSDRL